MPRETGYRIKIDLFVKTDPMDIERLGAVYRAIKKAQDQGEPADLVALGSIEAIHIKSTSRNAAAKAETDPEPNATQPIPLAAPGGAAQADQDDKLRAEAPKAKKAAA